MAAKAVHSYNDDDDLAYGDDPDLANSAGPGLVNEVQEALGKLRRFSGRLAQDLSKDIDEPYLAPESTTARAAMPPRQKSWRVSLASIQQSLNSFGNEVKNQWSGGHGVYKEVQVGESAPEVADTAHEGNRFGSFAPEREGNQAKWYVDGCGYMWAVSVALEQARHEIWIMDWWLSPELFLRRPPSKNAQYRLDRMLKAAAERGVRVNIIVYKEVTQALSLNSAHTKEALEALHPNISVFRHPHHLPAADVLGDDVLKDFKSTDFSVADIVKLPEKTLAALFGTHDETVLFWAHHEKLLLVDDQVAFLGGLDLCFGRWDTNQHSIADVHPGDIDRSVFPGQDYNNARIYDFQDLAHWESNKLDRTRNARMGWSDVSVCVFGPVVQDLRAHFAQRWNLIYDQKYQEGEEQKYQRLPDVLMDGAPLLDQAKSYGLRMMSRFSQAVRSLRQGEYTALDAAGQTATTTHRGDGYTAVGAQRKDDEDDDAHAYDYGDDNDDDEQGEANALGGAIDCQVLRSCSKWSHGVSLEHSIQNAYVDAIRDSKHFIYIENQFFITATGDQQSPILNQIGAAIVERISRAAKANEPFKIIVCIPAIPGFTGDLKSNESLSTRAIMDYQYKSINRGGHSIYEKLSEQGVEGTDYIRFYNLRSYDRINASAAMQLAEEQSGVSYEDARKEHDDKVGAGYGGLGEGTGATEKSAEKYAKYVDTCKESTGDKKLGEHRWDSVAECYMLGGEDLRDVPWESGAMDEIDAYVSEELYIHSKIMIVDDQIVLCGSANLNDRSQLGSHDSEIAVRIDDKDIVESLMAGQQWQASRFATTLRRQLFRKHLGLLKPQDMNIADENYLPMGTENSYDWNSSEDQLVADPLSDRFWGLWNERAQTNTDAFARVFHPVPTNEVKNWTEYDAYFERFSKEEKGRPESLWKLGHVVAENFPEGEAGLQEVKEILSSIRGNLVQMPLLFLQEEEIAKHGLTLNELTERLYT